MLQHASRKFSRSIAREIKILCKEHSQLEERTRIERLKKHKTLDKPRETSSYESNAEL